MRRASLIVVVFLTIAGPLAAEAQGAGTETGPPAAAEPFDWSPWAAILREHATSGGFRYAALRGNPAARARLRGLVDAIGDARPDGWARDARLAFDVNAYTGLVVNAVVDRGPIESVMRVEGFFDGARHRVAGAERTLNQLENDVLRRGFHEPRVHFALNCASASCPPLAGVPYTGRELEPMLDRQTRAFVRASTRVDRAAGRVTVSRLFEWYADDFGGPAGVRAFLASRLDRADAAFVRDAAHPLVFAEYDWALNGR
ncbi:MAG: DUF547 domain-containing protein [Sandaracinaceae bacterium]